jgi:hypothetical protein
MCQVCAVLWCIVAGGVVLAVVVPQRRKVGLVAAGSALALGAAVHYSKEM